MAVKTTLEQLTEVQDAITKVMAAQSYAVGGRSTTKAQLAALTERESLLLERYRRENSGANINRVQFRRPI